LPIHKTKNHKKFLEDIHARGREKRKKIKHNKKGNGATKNNGEFKKRNFLNVF